MELTHPYNHCLSIIMDKHSKELNFSLDKAQSICYGLQGGGKPDPYATANIKANADREVANKHAK